MVFFKLKASVFSLLLHFRSATSYSKLFNIALFLTSPPSKFPTISCPEIENFAVTATEKMSTNFFRSPFGLLSASCHVRDEIVVCYRLNLRLMKATDKLVYTFSRYVFTNMYN